MDKYICSTSLAKEFTTKFRFDLTFHFFLHIKLIKQNKSVAYWILEKGFCQRHLFEAITKPINVIRFVTWLYLGFEISLIKKYIFYIINSYFFILYNIIYAFRVYLMWQRKLFVLSYNCTRHKNFENHPHLQSLNPYLYNVW